MSQADLDQFFGQVRDRARTDRSLGKSCERRRFRRRRTLALVGAGVLLAGGAAYGTVRWTANDLPPHGKGPSAFVSPAPSATPAGGTATAAPVYAELPIRPAITFPKGVTYEQALRAYFEARQEGADLPPEARLTDPLPSGKVVTVHDDVVSLDPAAPAGFDLSTGLVRSFVTTDWAHLPAPALAACQVVLDGTSSEDCPTPPASVATLREVGGRWVSAQPEQVRQAPPLVSTALAILTRPAAPPDTLPPALSGSDATTSFKPFEPFVDQARLALSADGYAYWVVPAANASVCLVVTGHGETHATCGPLTSLATSAAIPISFGTQDGHLVKAALVSSDFTTVSTSDGQTAPVGNNVVAFRVSSATVRLSAAGPDGTRTLR